MKIYTKMGDGGKTSLVGGAKFLKDSPRIKTYGEVDELNALVGLVRTGLMDKEVSQALFRIQRELFVLGTELATPKPTEKMSKSYLQDENIVALEKDMDRWDQDLPSLKHFILPGGTRESSYLHLARTVCRRAERSVVSLGQQELLRSEVIRYLNRLSDWFFVLARWLNRQAKVQDTEWKGLKDSSN